jgi:hypothetical protein
VGQKTPWYSVLWYSLYLEKATVLKYSVLFEAKKTLVLGISTLVLGTRDGPEPNTYPIRSQYVFYNAVPPYLVPLGTQNVCAQPRNMAAERQICGAEEVPGLGRRSEKNKMAGGTCAFCEA